MKIKKYFYLTKISIKSNLTYLKSFLLSRFFLILILFVLFNLYKTIYRGNAAFDGFTIPMIIYYIVITESILLSNVRIYQTISEEIKEGSCVYNLLRPISYIMYHYFTASGKILLNLFSTLIVGIITAGIMVGFNIIIIKNIFLSLPVIIMGINIDFFIMVLIGMFAFKMEEVSPIFWIYQKILFILGGLFFPLEFFPVWIKKITPYLPTSYILYFPARLIVKFQPSYYLKGFLIQVIYLVSIIFLTVIFYKKGIRNLTINGG